MARGHLLIGDLGGTHARFARASREEAGYSEELTLDCGEYASAESAIEDYLDKTGGWMPEAVCLALAAPITGRTARFLNSDWRLETDRLEQRFPDAEIKLLNDFQAAAYSLPLLGEGDLRSIGRSFRPWPPDEEFTVGLVGPGTGLGVSGLIRVGGKLHALASEGGHQGFAPQTDAQFELLRHLRTRWERVSNERLLSGPGIEAIYRAVQVIQGRAPVEVRADEVFERASSKSEAAAVEAERLFFEILGQVAGDLALMLGAREGVFIGGGMVPRHPDRLASGPFRQAFENKGRHRWLMEQIPTRLITHPASGLLGAAWIARGGEAE